MDYVSKRAIDHVVKGYKLLYFAQVLERRHRRYRPSLSGIAAAMGALLVCLNLGAQPTELSAYQVEAAYIYNFGKFVKWPANAAANQSSSFRICVLGDDDPFASILQATLAGESLGGRPVAVRRISKPENAVDCHVLFIRATEQSDLRAILSVLDQVAVLTVSDMPDFSKRGGMIQFVLESNRVRFVINRERAEGNGLILASDLLKVATLVIGTGRKGGQ